MLISLTSAETVQAVTVRVLSAGLVSLKRLPRARSTIRSRRNQSDTKDDSNRERSDGVLDGHSGSGHGIGRGRGEEGVVHAPMARNDILGRDTSGRRGPRRGQGGVLTRLRGASRVDGAGEGGIDCIAAGSGRCYGRGRDGHLPGKERRNG